MPGAFEPFRILDFSTRLPGAMATMLLADLGADVIRVESPAQRARRTHPGFLCWDRNKRRVALDVTTFAGLRDARKLIATADAAVFDDAPGELERLGLDGATVCAANPRLLHTWMPPYAPRGRWSELPADELLLSAVTGVARMQPSYAGNPVAIVTPQVGYAHATIAANAIAAGLWERQRSGGGQALTVSGLHAVSSIESGGAITYDGAITRVAGRGSRGGVPHYRLYRCADGEWFFLGSLTAPFFLKALEAIGLTEILTEPGIEGDFMKLFVAPGAELAMARLDAHFATMPRAHWLRILHEAGVPRGPVGRREEWFREETVAANGMRVELEHPVHGRVELPGVPTLFSDTPGAVRGFVQDVALDAALAERPAAAEPAPAPADAPRAAPLAGVKVLDLGAFIAGTYAPTVLANLGADVIKIEPTAGDPFRAYGLSALGHNLGKRSLAMDIKHPEGRAIFEEMVRQSDVVLDNFRMGVRERLGIDYATLAAINPRIITCSVTGYGPKGELSGDPGFDPIMQARSGMMRAQGGEDEPVFHQIAVNDTATAMMAAFAMQAALHAREQTGRGQEVHTSLAAQSVLFQSGELTWYEGREPAPVGGIDFIGPGALRRFYACADGWIALAVSRGEEFQQLALALDHPEWAGRMTAEQALAAPAAGELADLIGGAFAALPLAGAIDRMATRAVPAAPALAPTELFADPWLLENGMFRTVADRNFGTVTCVRAYADWSRSEAGFAFGAPALGEHSREVLARFGVDEAGADALIAAGVVAAG